MDEKKVGGDWLEWVISNRFCLQSKTIKEDAEATEGLVSGQVLEDDDGKKVVVQDIDGEGPSLADSILVEPVDLESLQGGDTERLCLVRGPAIINSAAITNHATEGAEALLALSLLKIISVANPTTNTQTT